MNTKWAMGVLFAMGLFLPAIAQEPVKTEAPAKDTVKAQTAPKTGDDKKVAELAERYKVTEAEVRGLRDNGLGWGEANHALGISQKAGVPLADVMKLRDSGMGWGKIAQNYGFKLGDVAGKKQDASTLSRGPADKQGVKGGEGASHGHGPKR